MTEIERDEHGRFTPTHSDEAVLGAVEKHAPAGTNEVANELGIERPSADYRLRQLAEAGEVTNTKIGGSLAWFLDEG